MSMDTNLKEILGEQPRGEQFDMVSISIAAPDRIRS